MATTEYEEEPPPSQVDRLQAVLGMRMRQVTDTDSTLPLRTFVLMLVIAICLLFAPMPANLIGIVATTMLAMSAATRYHVPK